MAMYVHNRSLPGRSRGRTYGWACGVHKCLNKVRCELQRRTGNVPAVTRFWGEGWAQAVAVVRAPTSSSRAMAMKAAGELSAEASRTA